MHRFRFTLLLLLAPAPATAQAASPRADACAAPEHHQFDFWIGQWDVQLPDGSQAGTNRIEPILGGCALQESWSGAAGGTGYSYNVYDRSRKLWHQTWVDSQGNLLQLEGDFADDRMTLEGESRDSTGAPILNRVVWRMTAPGRVRQLWETSKDRGTTWTVAFDGRYIKR